MEEADHWIFSHRKVVLGLLIAVFTGWRPGRLTLLKDNVIIMNIIFRTIKTTNRSIVYISSQLTFYFGLDEKVHNKNNYSTQILRLCVKLPQALLY